MSLYKIAMRLRYYGLTEPQIDQVIDMIRDFALAAFKRALQ